MIGERIHKLRIQQGLSLSELADRADIAKSYLSTIERLKQVNPSIQVIERIANVLKVPVQVLLDPNHSKPLPTLDSEWIALAQEARDSGISIEQFREFLEFQKWKGKQMTLDTNRIGGGA